MKVNRGVFLSLFLLIFIIGVVGATTTSVITSAADRLVSTQNADGGWEWTNPDTNPSTGVPSPYNTLGVTAQGFLDAYKLTGNLNYLNAAKNVGNYIVSVPLSTSQRQNAYNIVFLYNLGQITGNSAYTNKANSIYNSIFNQQNYWSLNNGNFCGNNGCTPSQLIQADENYRSNFIDGIVPWDLVTYVEAAKDLGDTPTALAIQQGINSYLTSTNYVSTIPDYSLGLSAGIKADVLMEVNPSSLVASLLAAQNPSDNSFGTVADGQVQATSYAILALLKSGNSATNAVNYLLDSQLPSSGFDSPENTEVTSEAIQAIYNYAPFIIQSQQSVSTSAGVPSTINPTGTDAGIILTTSTSQTGTVTVQQSGGDSHGGFGAVSLGKFIEINSTIPNSAISNVEIRIYYTHAELTASNIVESSLKLYWYNSVSGKWEVIVPSGVNTLQNYVWGITNHFSTYTLGGGSGPGITISNNICGGYTNNASVVLFGNAYDSSGQTINLVAYNRSDDASGVVRNAALIPPLTNNVSFNTQPDDPIFTTGNNTIFIWGGSNQTGPVTVCQFFVDTVTPTQVNNANILASSSACVPNYVNVAPQFSWNAATDTGGSGINHYDIQLFQNSVPLGGAINVGNILTFTVPSPINGDNYSIQIRAVDNAGNVGVWSANSPTIWFDNQLPSATINSDSSIWHNSDFSISETDTDNTGLFKCEYKIYNQATGITTKDWTVTPCNQDIPIDISQYCPVNGLNKCWIYKRATDNACNLHETWKEFDIDTTAPITTTSISPLSVFFGSPFGQYTLLNYFLRNTATITLNCNDAGVSGCPTLGATKYQIIYPDGTNSGLQTYSTPFILNNGDGFYNVSYYSTDNAGNIELLKSEIDKVDTQSPITTIKTVGQSYTNSTGSRFVSSNTQFNLNCTDSEVGCQTTSYQVDTNTIVPNSGNVTFSLTTSSDGQHNISYWSVDKLENIEPLNSQLNYLDTVFPLVIVHNPTPLEANNVSNCVQAVVIEANDLGSGVNNNTLRAELWSNSTSTTVQNVTLKKTVYGTYEALIDKQLPAGNYTLKIYASDNLGNTEVIMLNEQLLNNSIFV